MMDTSVDCMKPNSIIVYKKPDDEINCHNPEYNLHVYTY